MKYTTKNYNSIDFSDPDGKFWGERMKVGYEWTWGYINYLGQMRFININECLEHIKNNDDDIKLHHYASGEINTLKFLDVLIPEDEISPEVLKDLNQNLKTIKDYLKILKVK